MSISTSYCLLLLLLFLSLHGCYARRDLGSVVHSNKSKHKFDHYFSNKVHVDHSNTAVSNEISTSTEKLLGDHDQSTGDKTRDDHFIKDKSLKGRSDQKGTILGYVKYQRSKKSQISVPWLVPHKKRGEKQPGFNLDYSPPKTHPPSHN